MHSRTTKTKRKNSIRSREDAVADSTQPKRGAGRSYLYHGTSKGAAQVITKNGGFAVGGERGLKDLTGFEVEPGRPVSLTRDKRTAMNYVSPRPEGGSGELLTFDARFLKIATPGDLKKIAATDFESFEILIPKLRKAGFDGFEKSSPHDELVETVVINPEKLKLIHNG